MKKCTKCKIEKQLDDFSPNKKGDQGRQSSCKKCNAEIAKEYRKKNPGMAAKQQAEYREKNPNKIREYNKKNWKENKEKLTLKKKEWDKKNPNYYSEWYWSNDESRKKKKESHKKWLDKNKEYQKIAAKLHKERYPEKVRARDILRKAVYYAKIEKPKVCQECKMKKTRIEGHHEDYSKPLEVIWLCVSCHRKIHKEEVSWH